MFQILSMLSVFVPCSGIMQFLTEANFDSCSLKSIIYDLARQSYYTERSRIQLLFVSFFLNRNFSWIPRFEPHYGNLYVGVHTCTDPNRLSLFFLFAWTIWRRAGLLVSLLFWQHEVSGQPSATWQYFHGTCMQTLKKNPEPFIV